MYNLDFKRLFGKDISDMIKEHRKPDFSNKKPIPPPPNFRILVVDDEDIKLGEIAGIAMANGFSCDYARSAPEAWIKLSENPAKYILMISDNSMPTNDTSKDGYDYNTNNGLPLLSIDDNLNQGLQLLRRVREHPILQSLDVIIYTGGSGREQVEALGATYIQQQPPVLDEILKKGIHCF